MRLSGRFLRRFAVVAQFAVLAFFAVMGSATASVRVAERPNGWARTAAAQARERAAQWAERIDGKVLQLMSTRVGDDFVETIVVIELLGPIGDEVDLNPRQELMRAIQPLLVPDGRGTTTPHKLTDIELLETTNKLPPIVRGSWVDDGVLHKAAVVSSGPNRALVLFVVLEEDELLYARAFENLLRSIEGIRAPLSAFAHKRWWIGNLVAWALFVGLAWGFVSWRGTDDNSSAGRGRWVGGACIFAVVVGATLAFMMLENYDGSLAVAGLSRVWVVAELAMVGLGFAIASAALGLMITARVQQVQSAPSAGTFSGVQAPGVVRLDPARIAKMVADRDSDRIEPQATGSLQQDHDDQADDPSQ